MRSIKVFNFVIVFLFSGLLLHGQQVVTRASTKIELIKRRIKKSKNDTAKIKLLQQWSDLVFITDPEKDLELQEEVLFLTLWGGIKNFGKIVFKKFLNAFKQFRTHSVILNKNYLRLRK